ncbi:hypothetical protein HY643_04805 [Candidatus Woesearchaeota archaeon]|nr:hypothetical protein [Candidatus Woesearchaeota archaeon]
MKVDRLIKKRLIIQQNLPKLEQIIIEESTLLTNLQKKKPNKKYPILKTKEELEGALMEVKLWVDSFLKVKEEQIVTIRLGKTSEYDKAKEEIWLAKVQSPRQYGELAHEYTHFLQSELLDPPIAFNDENVFIEGHARGVEKAFNKWYAQNNPKVGLIEVLETSLEELTNSYAYISKKFKITMPKSTSNLIKEYSKLKNHEKAVISCYDLGNAFFSLAEKKHGKSIYARIMKKDFTCLKI